jgi:uncharacterized protein YjbI with pentapeptide repeats
MKRLLLVLVLSVAVSCGADFDGCPKKANGSFDCSYQDLSEKSLREKNLKGADFTGANLYGVDFYKANLTGANLSGLNLYGVEDFQHANLSGANLSGANLSGIKLQDVDLTGANLTGANLTDVNFSDNWTRDPGNLSGADLRGADLRGADLKGAIIKGADLSGLDLSGLNLSDSDLTGVNLEGVTTDAETKWPKGFDTKAAGVITTNPTTTTAAPTTTVQPLPRGFDLPPGDVIDRQVTLIDSGEDEINIKVRNSGTESAYYCIVMDYELDDGDVLAKNGHLILQGLGSWLYVRYGTDYSIPPDGQERVLILETRWDWDALMFDEYVGKFTYKIRTFEKLSSPC